MIAVSYSRIKDFEQCPLYFKEKYITKSFKEDSEAMSSGLEQHKQIEAHIRNGAALPKHLEHLAPLIANIRRAHEWVEPEQELAVDAKWAPVGWRDWDNVYIRAKLDLAAGRKDGRLTIIDWKTGKVGEGRDQMRLAAVMAFAHYDAERIDAAYVWTGHKQSDPFTIERKEEESLREHWEERAHEIQVADQHGYWRPTPSGFCRRCPVAPSVCPFKKSRRA